MSKKLIPQITIELPISKKEISIYEWMTQSELDEYQRLQLEDSTFDSLTGAFAGIKSSNLQKGAEFKIKCSLASITYEDYDVLHPKDRAFISDKISEAEQKNV